MPAARPTEAAWAVVPLDMASAAAALGVSKRVLADVVKTLPYYEARGNRKVFYPEHIAQLRREMHECAFKSNGQTVGPTFTAQAPMVVASDALSKLRMLAKPKKRGRT